MVTFLIVIASILLIAATTEVQLWCFTLNRHAWWSKNHPENDRRSINYKSLFYTSTVTAILSALTLATWMFIVVMGCNCPLSVVVIPALWFIGMGSKLILISYLTLIAKLCRLNEYYYPHISIWICRLFKRIVK